MVLGVGVHGRSRRFQACGGQYSHLVASTWNPGVIVTVSVFPRRIVSEVTSTSTKEESVECARTFTQHPEI